MEDIGPVGKGESNGFYVPSLWPWGACYRLGSKMFRRGGRCKGEGIRLYYLISLDVLSCRWDHLVLKITEGSAGQRGKYQVLAAQPWGTVENLLRKYATTNDFTNET